MARTSTERSRTHEQKVQEELAEGRKAAGRWQAAQGRIAELEAELAQEREGRKRDRAHIGNLARGYARQRRAGTEREVREIAAEQEEGHRGWQARELGGVP
jgi:hypothetical protein